MKTLASNCLFVKGYKKNLLIDLQNNNWYQVDFEKEKLFSDELKEDVAAYLSAHGILIDIPAKFLKNFPKISTHYETFQHVESVIMDFDSETRYDVIETLQKLDHLNPSFLQLRYFCDYSFDEMKKVISYLNQTTIEYVEILLPFQDKWTQHLEENNLTLKYSKFQKIVFHSVEEKHNIKELKNIFYTTEKIEDHTSCGQVGYFNFSKNSNHVLKSINFNSCLYKKIGIDTKGNIKNCPSLSQIAGTVFDSKIESHTFTTSTIKKDNIEVCKDCEFRNICTDCRAFTDSKSRPNARPSGCDYNPYIAKWSHEEGYVPLADCGIVSTENEFSINHKKILEINKCIIS